VKNRAHARLNPLARMRDDELTFDLACTTSDIDLPIATPLKVSDLFADHRRRSGGGFVLETFHRKSATARGRAAHRLCAHDGLFVAPQRGAVKKSFKPQKSAKVRLGRLFIKRYRTLNH
jgi:hypothetical protein